MLCPKNTSSPLGACFDAVRNGVSISTWLENIKFGFQRASVDGAKVHFENVRRMRNKVFIFENYTHKKMHWSIQAVWVRQRCGALHIAVIFGMSSVLTLPPAIVSQQSIKSRV